MAHSRTFRKPNRSRSYRVDGQRQRAVVSALLRGATTRANGTPEAEAGSPGCRIIPLSSRQRERACASLVPESDGPAPGSTLDGKDGPRNCARAVLLCPFALTLTKKHQEVGIGGRAP